MRRGDGPAVDLGYANFVAGKHPVLNREGGEPPPLQKLFCHVVAYLFGTHCAA